MRVNVVVVFCIFYLFLECEGSFLKGKNVPRVGRSSEFDGFDNDRHMMGYVIKTIPSKSIPRMGRRNYDTEYRYDIPKYYQSPNENDGASEENPMEIYYGEQLENRK